MVYICRLLCSRHHCIVGLAGEYDNNDDAKILEANVMVAFASAVEADLLNPWCEICGSRSLTPQIRLTGCKTMDEAKPLLKKMQEDELATRDSLLAAKKRASNN